MQKPEEVCPQHSSRDNWHTDSVSLLSSTGSIVRLEPRYSQPWRKIAQKMYLKEIFADQG